MSKYFSPATGFFYTEEVHGARYIEAPATQGQKAAGTKPPKIENPDCLIPKDAVPVSDAEYGKLLVGQGEGKAIIVKNGRPVAVEASEALVDHDAALAALKAARDRKLTASDWTQLPDAPVTDEQKAEAVTYRQQLRDWNATEALPVAPEWMTKA